MKRMLTDKLKALVENNMIDCDAHEDCVDCPLSRHVTITMPLGDLESLRENGDMTGNMPFGIAKFQVQPCMMFAEIVRQLPLGLNNNFSGISIEDDEIGDNVISMIVGLADYFGNKAKNGTKISSETANSGDDAKTKESPPSGIILVYEIGVDNAEK